MKNDLIIYFVLAVVAFLAMESGYSFIAFLVFVGIVLFAITQNQAHAMPSHAGHHEPANAPIILDGGHHDEDAPPGGSQRMNYILVSHKKNIEYQDYHNANFGRTMNSIGRGIADLLTPPRTRHKKSDS